MIYSRDKESGKNYSCFNVKDNTNASSLTVFTFETQIIVHFSLFLKYYDIQKIKYIEKSRLNYITTDN